MRLKDFLRILIFCGEILMPFTAFADMHDYPAMQEQKPEKVSTVQKKELSAFRKKYKLSIPEANDREIENAKNQVQLYQLNRIDDTTVEGNAFNGKITLQQARDLAKTVRAMAAAAHIEGGKTKKDFNLLLDFLFSQNIIENIPKFKYSNYNDVRKVPADLLSALPICDDRRKIRLTAAVQNLLEGEQLHLSAEEIREKINSDYIFNVVPHLFICAIHNPNDELAVKELAAFSHFLSACTQYSPSGYDILKPDGTGFHHNSHYNGYMYSYKTWVEYMGRLKGTSFRIEKEAYLRMRKAVVSEYLMAVRSDSDNHRIFGNSMAGRHPFTGIGVNFSRELLETLIEVGGDIDGIPHDLELGSYYNYFYKTKKYKNAPELNADGYYQFNFSAAGVYRKDNWVAVMRCPTTNFWGGELYNKQNRFGRYQSHGTLEVLYEGGLSPSGYPTDDRKKNGGWDWNMMPGSTTVHYPDWQELMPGQNDADRFDQKSSTTNFAGALAWKNCGLFGAAFDQDDKWGKSRYEPTNLKFCKSVFAIDGMLFSMGTNIEAKGTYPDDYITATNLFQSVMSKDCKTLIVDGQKIEKGEEKIIGAEKSVWIVAPTTTGYYIPEGHDKLIIRHNEQETPSSAGMAAEFGKEIVSKAYLEHGVKPEKSAYHFLTVPAVMPEQMKEIAGKQEAGALFEVMTEQDSLHIVKYHPTSTTAYTFFAPATGLTCGTVRASATELLVMEQFDKKNNKLELAICNPNLRPETIHKNYWHTKATPMAVELQGKWKVTAGKDVPGLTIEQNNAGNTVLKAKLTEGNPIYVTLEK